MGRAKIIWRQTRDSRCEVSNTFIKYIVPMNNEKPEIGKFIKAEINHNSSSISIYFEKTSSPATQDPQVIQEEHLFRVDFLK